VTCAIICSLVDGNIISDRPRFEFIIGSGRCLSAFEEAVKRLCMQSPKTKILLKSPYGKRGLPPNIPGDTDLIFEITLLKVDSTEIIENNNIDPSLYCAAQRLKIVKELNRNANDMCEKG